MAVKDVQTGCGNYTEFNELGLEIRTSTKGKRSRERKG